MIPLSAPPSSLDEYFYDLTLSLQKQNSSGYYWKMFCTYSGSGKIPKFIHHDNKNSIVVWTQPTFPELVSMVFNSTGGMLGLYVLILFTFGSYLRMSISESRVQLWISRMKNPEHLMSIILAIEAHQAAGEDDKEFYLAQDLLEQMRTNNKMIQLCEKEGATLSNIHSNYKL